MRLRRGVSSSIVLLLSTSPITSIAVPSPQQSDTSLTPRQLAREAPPPGPAHTGPADTLRTAAANIGTQDAPVDGKDGKPHAGPFVETAAERERKKAKDSGEAKGTSTSTNPIPKPLKGSAGGLLHSETSPIPESNNGVMDDPNRVGPMEGTRGTEGGVSEKDRDRKAQESYVGTNSEKKPDPPKEAPPLPHSEKENLAVQEGKEAGRKGKESAAKDAEKTKAVGGLEVSAKYASCMNVLRDRLEAS